MRTTLDIADAVLFAAMEIAQREKKTLGHVISELARRAFQNRGLVEPASPGSQKPNVSERLAGFGIRPLPQRGGIVSNELIDRLRDAEGV